MSLLPFQGGKFPEPRAFQTTAHEKLREGFRAGHWHQLLVAPTGAGKTYLGLRVVKETLAKGKRALFVCDRTALINQTSARADEYGLTQHAIIQANHSRRDLMQPFQIASIQTIDKRGYWPDADVIIIDEAHTQHSAWVEYLKITDAVVVGLTATPCSKGLGLSFSSMVNAATMDELTKLGVLVPLRILTCVTPDMKGAKTSGGEWTPKAASDREMQIIGDVVSEWQKHGEGRKTIAFGADIAYCTSLVQRFNEAGIGAEAYTSETGPVERERLLHEFAKPDSRIRILVSVEALAKGFDVQDIGCVIDARPLRKSLSTAIQMWGRGLRSSPDTGKTDCILLDHSSNIRRFYDDFVDIYFNGFKTLDTAEKLDAVARAEPEDFVAAGCPQCQHKPFRRRCLACGFEKITQATVDESAGEMQEIRIGKKVIAPDAENLWSQLCTYAKGNLKSDKKAGWCWHKFKEITGEEVPRNFPRFEHAPIVAVNPGTVGKLKQLRIKFHRRRAEGVEAR